MSTNRRGGVPAKSNLPETSQILEEIGQAQKGLANVVAKLKEEVSENSEQNDGYDTLTKVLTALGDYAIESEAEEEAK